MAGPGRRLLTFPTDIPFRTRETFSTRELHPDFEQDPIVHHLGLEEAEWDSPFLPLERTLARDPSFSSPEDRGRGRRSSVERVSSACALEIVIVDDYEDAGQSLAQLIRLWGHSVRVTRCGAEALRAAKDCDVLMLELALPDMDGCELVRRVRSNATAKCPFFVAVTTAAREDDFLRSAEAGIHLHLVKPVNCGLLFQVLHRFARIIAI